MKTCKEGGDVEGGEAWVKREGMDQGELTGKKNHLESKICPTVQWTTVA